MAEQSFKNIIELFPEAARVLSNHASVLSRQYRHGEAEAAIRLAIALQPARPEFSHIQAETLASAGRVDEAFVVFDEAINRAPNFEDTIFHHAILAYGCRRFEDGARDYRKRLALRDNENRMGDDRLSENLTGQLIVVEGDQGLGDEIHFLRFMAEIRKRGAQTRYIANPRLVPMLTRAATADEVIAKGSRQTDAEATHPCVGDLPYSIGLKDYDILPPTVDIPPAPDRLAVI